MQLPVLRTASLVACALLAGCSQWLFSGPPRVDRTRPVVLVETTGGVEFGAATEFGLLTLGRTATSGPCRVHYFLGSIPMIEDGRLEATASAFTRARIELSSQQLRALGRPLRPEDELVVMYTPDGNEVETVPVELAAGEGLTGDLLADPGTNLPAGGTLLLVEDEGYRFCGLVSARAVMTTPTGQRTCYTFAGLDRVRELVALPVPHTLSPSLKHRVDDITVPDAGR